MKPTCTTLSHTSTTLTLQITNINCTYLNTFRRTMINDLPTLAIDTVSISKYECSASEEFLCHRIGLIPIQLDIAEITSEDFTPKNIEILNQKLKQSVRLELSIKNTSSNLITVYSHDLKLIKDSNFLSNPKKGEIVKPNIPLIKLGRGQELELTCKLKVGMGIMHAKFCPVCPVAYKMKNRFILKFTELGHQRFTSNELGRMGEIVSRYKLTINSDGTLNIDMFMQESQFMEKYGKMIDEISKEIGKIKVCIEKDKTEFLFMVETTWNDPMRLFRRAVELVKLKYLNLKKHLE